MSDEIDPDLKRLFAVTAEQPSDETFIAEVTAKTARLRLLIAAGWGVSLVVLAVILAAFATGLATTLGQVTAMLAGSPFGWVALLALTSAGALCVRVLAGWRAP